MLTACGSFRIHPSVWLSSYRFSRCAIMARAAGADSRVLLHPKLHITGAKKGYIMMVNHTTISIRQVQDTVAGAFHLRRDDFASRKRSRQVACARHLAMYLSRELAGVHLRNADGERLIVRRASLPQIGRAFARDHTTVMYACAEMRRRCESDSGFASVVAMLSREVERSAASEALREVAV
jgi:hypothetical protein